MLRADFRYETGFAGGLAPYVPGQVSLPAGQAAAARLLDLLDGEALRDLESVTERMLLSEWERGLICIMIRSVATVVKRTCVSCKSFMAVA